MDTYMLLLGEFGALEFDGACGKPLGVSGSAPDVVSSDPSGFSVGCDGTCAEVLDVSLLASSADSAEIGSVCSLLGESVTTRHPETLETGTTFAELLEGLNGASVADKS